MEDKEQLKHDITLIVKHMGRMCKEQGTCEYCSFKAMCGRLYQIPSLIKEDDIREVLK